MSNDRLVDYIYMIKCIRYSNIFKINNKYTLIEDKKIYYTLAFKIDDGVFIDLRTLTVIEAPDLTNFNNITKDQYYFEEEFLYGQTIELENKIQNCRLGFEVMVYKNQMLMETDLERLPIEQALNNYFDYLKTTNHWDQIVKNVHYCFVKRQLLKENSYEEWIPSIVINDRYFKRLEKEYDEDNMEVFMTTTLPFGWKQRLGMLVFTPTEKFGILKSKMETNYQEFIEHIKKIQQTSKCKIYKYEDIKKRLTM